MRNLFTGILLMAFAVVAGRSGTAATLPAFEALSGLIQSNLTGVTDADLDKAATQGLVSGFKGRVVLVATNTPAKPGGALIAKQMKFEGALGYVRASRIAGGLPEQLRGAIAALGKETPIEGLVLDLRFANGLDYAVAGKTASMFVSEEQLLLEWEGGKARAASNAVPLRLPMVTLVNAQTRGAAEALAAVLRETKTALVIGGKTAGEANVFREFELPDGQRVRIAAGTVKLGDGSAMPADGLVPDIAVTVAPAEEKAFQSDPYRIVKKPGQTDDIASTTSTNTPRRRINEAELVRMQKEGLLEDDDAPLPAVKAEPTKPLVRDPALARGLDLLKALAIVKPAAK
jgi:hypothetical protein